MITNEEAFWLAVRRLLKTGGRFEKIGFKSFDSRLIGLLDTLDDDGAMRTMTIGEKNSVES